LPLGCELRALMIRELTRCLWHPRVMDTLIPCPITFSDFHLGMLLFLIGIDFTDVSTGPKTTFREA
jgi:hypothetical protein